MKHFPDIQNRNIKPPEENEKSSEVPKILDKSNEDFVIQNEKISDDPKVLERSKDNPKWKDIIEILNHRYRNQRIEYLVKQEGDQTH